MTLPRPLAALRDVVVARRAIRSTHFVLVLAAFLMAATNLRFILNVLEAYPPDAGNLFFVATLLWSMTAVSVLVLALCCLPYTAKPVAVVLLVASSLTAYFMDTYNTIVDAAMLDNVVKTDAGEVADLLSARLFVYLLLLGVLPSVVAARARIRYERPGRELLGRVKLVLGSVASVAVCLFALGGWYSTFLRENKPLRYYSNPGGWIYAVCKYSAAQWRAGTEPFRQIGLDARVERTSPTPKLVLLVVGESARADRFSLNGYERETNPRLAQEDVVSYTNFWSYGTSTAISVPYMFAYDDGSRFDVEEAKRTDNALDLLQRAGIDVRWLDNNSSSKGVAERIPYQTYKKPEMNPVYDVEARDVGMLSRLQKQVDAKPGADFLFVLHAMGNHGPAYHKRYPKEFERFTPIARTNQLQDCTDEEIGNAYDNAILYTDHFLAEAIAFLRSNDAARDVALLYVSDHGESLGENGIYLHGLPAFVAPDAQKHVPVILWVGDGFAGLDRAKAVRERDRKLTHQSIFHTVLGLMEVRTELYDPELDLF